MSCPDQPRRRFDRRRRALLKVGLLAGLLAPFSAFAARKPEKMPPQPGDHLVFAFGEHAGESIRADKIVVDEAPLAAYPKDFLQGIVRDRSRLNLVMVVRVDPGALSAQATSYATEGLVAYSAVCTHTGCTVEGWNASTRRMICPCHGSEYDATDAARVVIGPAPKPLAMLPLTVVDDVLVISGGFSRRVGFQQQNR